MTSSAREWQMIALNTMRMNLQRLYVFDRSRAMISGETPDEARTAALEGWMDAVGRAFGATLDGRELGADEQEGLLPLVPWLTDEVERYYDRYDPAASPRDQAAFGAAHVYAADAQTKGERQSAEAVGDEREADRLRQFIPMMMTLVQQANAAVGVSVRGEPGEQERGFIAEHVRVALGDRPRVMLQVEAIPVMLAGRDPRD